MEMCIDIYGHVCGRVYGQVHEHLYGYVHEHVYGHVYGHVHEHVYGLVHEPHMYMSTDMCTDVSGHCWYICRVSTLAGPDMHGVVRATLQRHVQRHV